MWRVLDVAADVAERAITPAGLIADQIPGQRRTLSQQAHRPWPLPSRPWMMGQTWLDLLFAHWRVPREQIDNLLPHPLRAELRDGSAWLGVTPFEVSGLRLRGVAPVPWLSRFLELNVRTYVEVDGKPGIYFFSLDAARQAAVVAARRAYRLPYFHARMRATRWGPQVRYESDRRDRSGPVASFRGEYAPAGAVTDDPLARWLAERYCLYVVDERGAVLRGDIHHPPWPLQPAQGELAAQGMAAPLGVEIEGEPLLHYSRRQDVVLWPLEPA